MANSETVAALSAYLKAISEMHKPNDWLDLRRRSMWHVHKVLAGQSIYTVDARELIRLICDGALHPQTREPLSHDRVRHLLEHTLEFLSWLDTNRRSRRMAISWDDRQNWHKWANEANKARLGAPEPGASFPPAGELELLVWALPTTEIAEIYGVSDVAVGKWCKSRNVAKPPRGFWAKVQANGDQRLNQRIYDASLAAHTADQLMAQLLPLRSEIFARRSEA